MIFLPSSATAARHHLLDLGEGPGTYSIQYYLNNQILIATVYDLPTTCSFAEKPIAKLNLQDRIDFKSGDYLEEDIKGRFDVTWLSQMLHGESFEDSCKIVKRPFPPLNPAV